MGTLINVVNHWTCEASPDGNDPFRWRDLRQSSIWPSHWTKNGLGSTKRRKPDRSGFLWKFPLLFSGRRRRRPLEEAFVTAMPYRLFCRDRGGGSLLLVAAKGAWPALSVRAKES